MFEKYVCFYLDYHFPKPSKLPLAATAAAAVGAIHFGTYCFCYFVQVECTCGVYSLTWNLLFLFLFGQHFCWLSHLRYYHFVVAFINFSPVEQQQQQQKQTHMYTLYCLRFLCYFCTSFWGIKINFNSNEWTDIKNIFTLISSFLSARWIFWTKKNLLEMAKPFFTLIFLFFSPFMLC